MCPMGSRLSWTVSLWLRQRSAVSVQRELLAFSHRSPIRAVQIRRGIQRAHLQDACEPQPDLSLVHRLYSLALRRSVAHTHIEGESVERELRHRHVKSHVSCALGQRSARERRPQRQPERHLQRHEWLEQHQHVALELQFRLHDWPLVSELVALVQRAAVGVPQRGLCAREPTRHSDANASASASASVRAPLKCERTECGGSVECADQRHERERERREAAESRRLSSCHQPVCI